MEELDEDFPCSEETCGDRWTLEWQDSDESWLCSDCGESCDHLDEYYMVHNSLWLSVMKCYCGMLCIGCLEKRLGRELTAEDFTDCPLNKDPSIRRSSRLASRLVSH